MKKCKEDLNRIHKEKCREIKRIRDRIAEDLGIELRQRECTYEGYCSGTCPACRKEEMQLNAALIKKQPGHDNRRAIENLSLLCRRLLPDHYVVKLPLIPGYSGRTETADSSEKLQALGIPAENISVFSYITP